MSGNGSFWRNVAIIAVAHVVVLAGLLRWNAMATKPLSTDIVWLEGGAKTLDEPAASPMESEPEAATLVAEAEPAVTPMEDPLTMKTPPPESGPDEEPTPTATPRSTPKVTPKPTPEPTAKKATTPKPSPKASATVKKLVESKNVSVKPAEPKAADSSEKKNQPVTTGENPGGSGGRASGAGGASQFGWYGKMLHDRFFSEWVQPKSVAMSGAKMAALVRVRIESDGRVSAFNIVRSSGNIIVDESVTAVAKRVTQVDPVPAGLGNAGHYDVNINFELNPE